VTESLDEGLPDDLSRAAEELMRRLAKQRWRVATAESCTGGLLSALLTDIEGASHAFDRGVVTYTKEAKKDLLGLDGEIVEPNDAVSERAARGMAEAILERSDADFAVAITGFAGPGAPGTEEGLVHIAVAARAAGTIHRVEHLGAIGRGPIRTAALRSAIAMLSDSVRDSGGRAP
jgi:nicotinamide-nucleotide amidase